MFNVNEFISKLDTALDIVAENKQWSDKCVVLNLPYKDVTKFYTMYSNGKAFCIYWEDMKFITEEFIISKEDFVVIYKAVLNELALR